MIELGKEKRQIIRPLCGQADHVLVRFGDTWAVYGCRS